MNATHLDHAAEVYANDGPTGSLVEVIRGDVRDYGNNVLFSGSAEECVSKKFRVQTRLVPTEWKKSDATSAETMWQLVIE